MDTSDARFQNWQAPMDEAVPANGSRAAAAPDSGAGSWDPLLLRLPPLYALGLFLRAQGLPDTAIGSWLHIEPEAVGPLLAVAEAKLAALAGHSGPEKCSGTK